MIRKAVKNILKSAAAVSAPLFSRKSTMDAAEARSILMNCSPKPSGTVEANNKVLEPVCDLQIVIPAYNVEQYLAACMDSVLSQQTKYTFQVILIDDGSTDQTPAIADRYAADPRVRIIHQANRGFSGARNVGLQELFGKYIMFVDSDDLLCSGAIEALLDAAFAHDCDVAEGGAWYLTEDKQTLMYRYDSCHRVPDAFVFHGQPWAKVYKAQLFANLCFPEGFWYEDSILAFLVWPGVQRAYVVPEMAYIHRRNPKGITAASLGRPKSADTYWITEYLMAARARTALPADDTYQAQLLDQIRLNHYRVKSMPLEIQESIFVLTCALLEQYFPAGLSIPQHRHLTNALKTRDFGSFRVYCKWY